MLAALVLAAGAALSARAPSTLEQRVSLMEARQMLQSQTLWTLQAALPPEAAKALGDLDLHLQEDRERDEKLEKLEGAVASLEARLQAVELLLGDRSLAEGAPLTRAPPQLSALVLQAKPQAKSAPQKHAKAKAGAQPARKLPAPADLSARQP